LNKVKELIIKTGGLDYAKNEIKKLFSQAQEIIKLSRMRKAYSQALNGFSKEILNV
jgi:geranylgeranyl pyrophosphate synthase